MPTTDQLFSIWESQFEFFGGAGLPKQSYGGGSESSFTSEKRNDVPIVPRANNRGTEGEIIGEIVWDKEQKDLRLKPSDDSSIQQK